MSVSRGLVSRMFFNSTYRAFPRCEIWCDNDNDLRSRSSCRRCHKNTASRLKIFKCLSCMSPCLCAHLCGVWCGTWGRHWLSGSCCSGGTWAAGPRPCDSRSRPQTPPSPRARPGPATPGPSWWCWSLSGPAQRGSQSSVWASGLACGNSGSWSRKKGCGTAETPSQAPGPGQCLLTAGGCHWPSS